MIIGAIVAGGSGSRMGGNLPKQFLNLQDKPVLVHTTERFLRHPAVDAVIIGINPDFYDDTRLLLQTFFAEAPVYLTAGGSNRNDTIVNIIEFACSQLHCHDHDIVLSHDAVRPFVTDQMIRDSINAMNTCQICTAAVSETDTVAGSADGHSADSFPDRNHIFRIQTPQTFRIGSFRKVYDTLSDSEKAAATDVCSLFDSHGIPVRLIEGSRNNIKLTYPADMIFAEALLQSETDGTE